MQKDALSNQEFVYLEVVTKVISLFVFVFLNETLLANEDIVPLETHSSLSFLRN